jgi:hypothetical protein
MGRRTIVVALALGLFAGTASAACEDRTGTTTRSAAPASSSAVVVRTDRTAYPAGARPLVVIRNGLRQAVTTTTGRTDCTIVAFDRLSGSAWKEVRNCYSGEPPRVVRIAAGATLRVRLIEQLDAGTYRARLEFNIRGVRARALSPRIRVA